MLIPLNARFFRVFNRNGGVSLPKLLVYFDRDIFCSLNVFSERLSVILNESNALHTHIRVSNHAVRAVLVHCALCDLSESTIELFDRPSNPIFIFFCS